MNIKQYNEKRTTRVSVVELDGIKIDYVDLVDTLNNLNSSDGLFSWTTGLSPDVEELFLRLEIAKKRTAGGLYKGPKLKELVEKLDIADLMDKEV